MPQTENSKINIAAVVVGLLLTGATIFTIGWAAAKGWKIGSK